MANIDKIREDLENFKINAAEDLERYRLHFLSKKSELQTLLSEIKNVPVEERKSFGQKVNELKKRAQAYFDEQMERLESAIPTQSSSVDVTRPATALELGSRHPISIMMDEVCRIFERIGFTTVHTSTLQVRTMEKQKPPIRVICPGRVFRNESITSRAHCIFHQMEGLYIDENVSFADMKQTLMYFAKQMFGENTRIRLRPSYFPFTEPSAEMDVSCNICGGKGCALCKHTGWVEILGCGMVDPNVLENCGIDSKKYTGFAFGLGIERMTMLKYKTDDIRLYFENDVRFLQQFSAAKI